MIIIYDNGYYLIIDDGYRKRQYSGGDYIIDFNEMDVILGVPEDFADDSYSDDDDESHPGIMKYEINTGNIENWYIEVDVDENGAYKELLKMVFKYIRNKK